MDEEKKVDIIEEATEETEENIAEETTEFEEETGNIKISVDVVSTIAGIAATQTKGVAGMYASFAGGIVEKFTSKKIPTKGVKVEMTSTTAKIDLYIVVEYGVRIPELAWEVQESVKNNVETMTGLEVDKVNIHIEGVKFTDEEAEEKPQLEEAVEEAETEITE